MKKIVKDPLFHFFVIGAILFILFEYFGNDTGVKTQDIIVDTAQIERIQAAWEKQWRRNPTDKELEKLIEEHIKEEVLFREAVNLGLDKDDTIIRRRLSQKMKFLIKDIASVNPPAEGVLKKYYQENQDTFKIPARFSFSHIYFNPDLRGNSSLDAASDLLHEINEKNIDTKGQGDSFMLHLEYNDVSEPEISRLFGRTFAKGISVFKPGAWQGPVRSGYGIHLVMIKDISPERIPTFDEVRGRVTTEYMNDFRLKANDKAIEQLKSRYRIIVKTGEATQVGSSASVSSDSTGSGS